MGNKMAQEAKPWEEFQPTKPAARQGVVIPKAGPTPIELQAAQLAKESAARAETSSIISQAAEQRAVSEDERKRVEALRGAYRGEDAVKDYEKAFPNYVAALKTGPNEDLTLLYLYAKTIDPQSTVGASDMENINASDARLPAAVQGALRELRASDGKFTDAARTSIRSGLHKVITEKNQAYKFTRDRFTSDAQSDVYNVDPMLVVGQPFGTQQQVDDVKSYWRKEYERNPESIPEAYRREEVAVPALKVAEAGGPRAADRDIAVARALQSAWQAGESIERLNEITQSMGTDPLPPATIKALEEDTNRQIKFTPFMAPTKDATEDMGFVAGAIEAVTGTERSTAETQSLPDWTTMPELNQLSTSSAAASLGTMFTSPEESVKIIQSNYPGVQVRQDEKGNFIMRSENGQEYAIKPGFRWSDVPRVAGGILAFIPSAGAKTVAGAAGSAGLTQGIIEATQAATGGTYNPEEVAMATGFGAGGKYLEQIVPPAIAAVRGMRRGPEVPLGGAPEVPAGMGGAVPEMPPMAPAQAAPMAATETVVEGAAPRVFEAGETVGGMRGGGAAMLDEAAIRAQRAQELPVPIELARFQRSRLFEEQQRARELAKNAEIGGPIRERLADQQQALRQNFDKFIDATGAEITENLRETGVAVDDALRKLARVAKARVNVLYKRAERAGETQEPISYQGLLDFINEQTPTTREKLAPVLKGVQEQLAKNDPTNSGMIAINSLEDVRKFINKVAQDGTPDSVYGKDMKAIIDGLTEGKGGELYQAARNARIQEANLFENTAIVRDLMKMKPGTTDRAVALANIAERAIWSGSASVDDIAKLKGALDLASNRGQRAWRELQGATMEHIRDQAYKGVSRDESGQIVINPQSLNTVINTLDRSGKLDVVFDKKTAELLRTVNSVAQDMFTAPPGSVNNSNTSSAVLNAVDMVVTYLAAGIPFQSGQVLNSFRKSLQERGLKKEVKRLLD